MSKNHCVVYQLSKARLYRTIWIYRTTQVAQVKMCLCSCRSFSETLPWKSLLKITLTGVAVGLQKALVTDLHRAYWGPSHPRRGCTSLEIRSFHFRTQDLFWRSFQHIWPFLSVKGEVVSFWCVLRDLGHSPVSCWFSLQGQGRAQGKLWTGLGGPSVPLLGLAECCCSYRPSQKDTRGGGPGSGGVKALKKE